MQFLLNLRPNCEVLRANILSRGTTPDMDSILSEETRILTQATLEGKKEVESVFLLLNAGDNSKVCPKFSFMNARTLDMLVLTVRK